MSDSKTERYEVDGYEVVYRPWHSECMDEDFVAVSILKDGRELMHAGMAKLVPSEQQAREDVETMLRVLEVKR